MDWVRGQADGKHTPLCCFVYLKLVGHARFHACCDLGALTYARDDCSDVEVPDCEWAAAAQLRYNVSHILKEKQTEKRTFNEDRNESIRSTVASTHTWCYPFYHSYTQTYGGPYRCHTRIQLRRKRMSNWRVFF